MKAKTLDLISVFLAELIGTGFLVFFGCMSCISFVPSEGSVSPQVTNSLLQISIVFGLVIMFLVQIFGCVSGSHFNPAVTVAALVYKMVTPAIAVGYFVAQMGGAFIGYGLLKALIHPEYMEFNGGLCVTRIHPSISPIQGMFIELIGTGTLIWVVCGVWDPRNAKGHDAVPLKLGLAITALCGCFGEWTGCSMNPARSFGPAVWNVDFLNHWVYWFGPLLGGLLASLSYRYVFYRNPVQVDEKKRMEEMALN